MSFFEYIEKLQNKPEPERRRIALMITSFIFSFIFFGWIASLGVSWSLPEDRGGVYKAASPFATVKKAVDELKSDMARGWEVVVDRATGEMSKR